MSEALTIKNSPEPRTYETLKDDFQRLGLKKGMIVLVHSSLSKIGWVNGGPVPVIQALMDTLESEGMLVMPAQSGDYSDPANWQNPPVPETWHQTIRDTMPAFDPQKTPTRGMGRIAESFRTWPGVIRSYHPSTSFSAWGKYAERITADHSLSNSLGDGSPLARIYELGGYVLLLGVGYDRNTSFHLAEYRIPYFRQETHGAPILENGRRVWKTYSDIEYNDHLFPEIGASFEQAHPVVIGKVGSATCRFFQQKTGVDYAVSWLLTHYGNQKSR